MAAILQKEAPVLRGKAEAVNRKDFDSPRLKKIIAQMVAALEKEEDGIAIAAPQIGVPLRIFVVSHRAFEFAEQEEGVASQDLQYADGAVASMIKPRVTKYANMVFINPEITKLSRKKHWAPEGCLSVRWLYGEVARAEKATVRAHDEHGKLFTRGGSGLLAQVFQHETDHLNGVLFIDKARNIEKITMQEQMARDKNTQGHRKH
jgi:peptide deformylase